MVSRKFNSNFSDILIRSLEPDKDKEVKITTRTSSTSWQPGIRILKDSLPKEEFTNELYLDLLSFVANEYKERLKEAINTQEFRNKWPPLNEDYKKWKERAGLDPRMWIRSGQLLEAIRVRFIPRGSFPSADNVFAVGIDENERYREIETVKDDQGNVVGHRRAQTGDVSIAWVARLMEFGTSDMPARKLFRPVQERISKNIRPIIEDWTQDRGLDIELN